MEFYHLHLLFYDFSDQKKHEIVKFFVFLFFNKNYQNFLSWYPRTGKSIQLIHCLNIFIDIYKYSLYLIFRVMLIKIIFELF